MTSDATKDGEPRSLGGLDELLRQAAAGGRPPVEQWNPPYCGDIGMAIRADGSWDYQNSPIRRPAMVKLFASVLRKDSDGRTYLVTPGEKVDVVVEDAPFLAVEMHVRGGGAEQELIFRTNVDDVVSCGPAHPLRFAAESPGGGAVARPGGGLKPYVLVRGRLEALLTRALVYELAALAVEEERAGGPVTGVWSGGHFFAINGSATSGTPTSGLAP
jgi:uncharacterized protein